MGVQQKFELDCGKLGLEIQEVHVPGSEYITLRAKAEKIRFFDRAMIRIGPGMDAKIKQTKLAMLTHCQIHNARLRA